MRELGAGVRGQWHVELVSADASAVSHMSERPQEVRAHARGRAHRKVLCCRSPPGKELLLRVPGRVFYLKALFTPALSVISGPSLLYLPLLALSHTFVLQLLCFFR